MTGDPKRWLDPDGDATEVERSLLRSGGDMEPPANARGAVWAAIATRLPPIGGGPGGSAPPTGSPPVGPAGGTSLASAGAKTAIGSLVLKAGAAIAVAGVAVAAATYALRTPDKPSSVASPAQIAPSATVTGATPVASMTTAATGSPADRLALSPTAEATGSAPPTSDAPPAPTSSDENTLPPRPVRVKLSQGRAAALSASKPSHTIPTSAASRSNAAPVIAAGPSSSDPSPATDALRDESALLGNARAAVRRGDSRSALASLEVARTRYPSGALVQEREVLTIEALAQSGDADAASSHASRFLTAFPSSPHAAHVRTFVR
jgi:hypothetical protein